MKRAFCIAGIVLAVVLLSEHAHAQGVGFTVDDIVARLQRTADIFAQRMEPYALEVFGFLAAIDLVLTFAFSWASDENWIAKLAREILILGFYLALIQNGVRWAQ